VNREPKDAPLRPRPAHQQVWVLSRDRAWRAHAVRVLRERSVDAFEAEPGEKALELQPAPAVVLAEVGEVEWAALRALAGRGSALVAVYDRTQTEEARWMMEADEILAKPHGETELLRRVGMQLEISARKAAERALRESQAASEAQLRVRVEELQALMDMLPVGVFLAHDSACTQITMNAAGAAMLRLTPGANASKTGPEGGKLPFRVLKNGRELGLVELPMQRAARTSIPVIAEEYEIAFHDGDSATFYEYAMPLFDEGRRTRGCLGVFVDITSRKRAERQVRESEARYRSLVTVLTDVAWTTDAAGAFVVPQAAWAAFTGQSWEEHRGFGWLNAVHPDDRAGAAEEWARMRRESGAYVDEMRIWHAGTRAYRLMVARATPLHDAQGRLSEWVGACTDVEEQRRTEETLERLVAERTAELRESNEQLEAFVYSIAHDLRSPLRAMTGYSQLLLEEHAAGLKAEAQGMLQRIRASSEFMDRLVLDLLAYGQVARSTIEVGPVSLENAWAAAVFQCATEIEKTGARVEVERPLPAVIAQEATLGQCFANLLANALKFVAPGTPPVVRLTTERHEGRVKVWVSDNGLGIPAEQHARVFRTFERLHSAQFPGTGLGLSIVRKGVERMGGNVGVESVPGQGSRFWIELVAAEN
jgi:PAS domain S-box-containing protein